MYYVVGQGIHRPCGETRYVGVIEYVEDDFAKKLVAQAAARNPEDSRKVIVHDELHSKNAIVTRTLQQGSMAVVVYNSGNGYSMLLMG
jgi:hypothetical protein